MKSKGFESSPMPLSSSGCAEPLGQFFRTLRPVGQALEQRAQIQSSANGEYRQALALPQVCQNLQGQLAVAACSRIVLWPKNVDQMMRNAAAFEQSWLCRPNIKAAIELGRIASHSFPAQPLSEHHAKRPLSRCRRTNNGNGPQERVIF